MIIEYHRPENEQEAIALLNRSTPVTVPLGGGTVVSKTGEEVAVVDLQSLKLDQIEENHGQVLIGSMTNLEALLGIFGRESAVGKALLIEAGKNIRGMATLGGSLVANGGRSSLLTVLVALGAELIWKPGDKTIGIEGWLSGREQGKPGKYIAQIRVPAEIKVEFESIGRSPLDQPVICCAVAKLPSGNLRIALGGFGNAPKLAYAGDASGNYRKQVENCLENSGDQWASAAYRMEAGNRLVQRLVNAMAEGK